MTTETPNNAHPDPVEVICAGCGNDFFSHRGGNKPDGCKGWVCTTHIPEQGGATGCCSVCGEKYM